MDAMCFTSYDFISEIYIKIAMVVSVLWMPPDCETVAVYVLLLCIIHKIYVH
jgi:hypothetical protein